MEGGENWARYSMIGLGESTVFSCNAGILVQQADGSYQQDCSDPFRYIHGFQAGFPRFPPKKNCLIYLALQIGLVGYLGYDASYSLYRARN
ncbi:MAG: hypothetical protein U1E88_00730 [Acinetobacter sp.]